MRAFAEGGRYPFSLFELISVLTFCGARRGADLARRARSRDPLVLRRLRSRQPRVVRRQLAARREHRARSLRGAADRGARALAQVAGGRCRWRRVALVLAGVWNLSPHAWSYSRAPGRAPPTRRLLAARDQVPARAPDCPRTGSRSVDTAGHWAAVHLPAAGIPLTRGWFRQDDFPQNEVLYDQLDRADLPDVAAQPRRALRRPDRRAHRLQREGGGAPDRERPLRPRSRAPHGAHDDLRRSPPAADPDRPGHRARCSSSEQTKMVVRLGWPGPLPARRPLLAVLARRRRPAASRGATTG